MKKQEPKEDKQNLEKMFPEYWTFYKHKYKSGEIVSRDKAVSDKDSSLKY